MSTRPDALAPPEHRVAYPNLTVGATLSGDQELAADVVVVGSGAGGATAAARLRDAGLKFRNDIITGPGGSQIILDDPSGNPVELFEPKE